jgi:hypothetical protein
MNELYDDFYARERIIRDIEEEYPWDNEESVPEDLLATFDDLY